ncbi:zinc finger protein [Theobroma cacao]|nr:zinc finger protein [Theobroma cacao]
MAAASSSTPFFGTREENQTQMIQQQSSSTPTSSTAPTTAPQKKKRNQPGTPSKYLFTYICYHMYPMSKANNKRDPDAEVIALSPKTLMATNRFICEVCNKGFQREQNLQLHRRGHNLPWKLRQKTTKEVKRKVYLCPEPTCVHHDPSRALGDLTGIKKHYSRKHGEKKWKCEKCSKRYAVQSDWKAHSKTCGTREYRCDCGTLFSSSRTILHSLVQHLSGEKNQPPSNMLRLGSAGAAKFEHLIPPSNPSPLQNMPTSAFFMPDANQGFHHQDHQSHHGHGPFLNKPLHGLMQLPDLQGNTNNTPASTNLFNLGFFPNNSAASSISTSENASASTANLPNSGFLSPNQFNSGNGGGGGQGTAINYGGGGGETLRSQMENDSNLQGLMNSLANGNSSIFGAGHGQDSNFGGFSGSGMTLDQQSNNANFCNVNEAKLHQNLAASIGGTDKLTLDFLGVGGMVRNMGGGFSQREQHGINISSLDPEVKSAQANQQFGSAKLL